MLGSLTADRQFNYMYFQASMFASKIQMAFFFYEQKNSCKFTLNKSSKIVEQTLIGR